MTDPGQPGPALGMTDFFALEAAEYLDRLDGLLQPPPGSSPVADEFVRLARALRGSALMARQQPIARAAAGLEALARTVRDGTRMWDAETRQIAVRAVDDLRIFVRRASSWTEADTAKAEALGTQLGQVAGRASAQIRVAETLGLDAGARAFVAREGAAIASALDRAAQALRTGTRSREALQSVQRAIQPLRGLAALTDLPPLADLLEVIERTATELAAPAATPPPGAADLLQSAAGAVTRAARDVAERGRPDPEGVEFQQFAALVFEHVRREPEVVAISALYYDDAGPHVVRPGAPAQRPSGLARVEVVSHGEHLRQAADGLERAPGPTARRLRAHGLAASLRALGDAGAGPLGDAMARFAAAARHALAGGVADDAPTTLSTALRQAGDLLARASAENEATLATRLEEVAAGLRTAPDPSVVAGTPMPVAATAPAGPAAGEPVASPETDDLAGSWARYERLASGAGRPSPALHATAEPAVVDIQTLVYRGERAARRAQDLRAQASRVPDELLRAIFDEVCDLVVLAQEPGPPGR